LILTGESELSEARLQSQIVQYLQSKNIYFFSVPNEAAGRDAAIRMARMKAMGLRSGVSDLVLVLPGRVVFLEVKEAGGVQSEAQKRFQEKVEALGHQYFLVKSLEDLQKVVDTIVNP
jgi:hypothetical protein